MSELWELGAFELGTSIRDRVVSSRDAVEAHIARIDKGQMETPASFRSQSRAIWYPFVTSRRDARLGCD